MMILTKNLQKLFLLFSIYNVHTFVPKVASNVYLIYLITYLINALYPYVTSISEWQPALHCSHMYNMSRNTVPSKPIPMPTETLSIGKELV